MNLGEIKNGSVVKVLSIDAGMRLFNRLASMGLSAGKTVTIVRNSGEGPVIVDLDGSRIAVGRGMAEKIFVETIK